MACERRYTIDRQERGYPPETRAEAYKLFEQGLKIRQIAKQLNVNHQSVANWIRERKQAPETAAAMPPAAPPVDFGPHKRRPTISDVAKKANVSTATVSSYINHKGRMGQATRKRIQAAMEELHYTPNALVRAIRQQRTHIFGVLLFGLSTLDEHVGDSLTPPLLAGISHAADEAENDMLLYSGWPDHPQRRSGLSFLNGHIDGLLWVAPEMHEPAMERVAAADLPVVALLSRHVPDEVGYVNADNFGAMQQVVDHLSSLGHERIAYIGPAHSSNFKDRIEGYRNAMRDAGLNADKNLEAIIPHPRRSETTAGTLDRLLALTPAPTAIIAADDGLAGDVFSELQARGIRVPEDIALTGFNDIFDGRHIAGGLTTIRQPFRDMGQIATERLLAMIGGAPVDQCRVTLPTTLIVRRSTVGG
jgi:LacI family transcriptional regulator